MLLLLFFCVFVVVVVFLFVFFLFLWGGGGGLFQTKILLVRSSRVGSDISYFLISMQSRP